MSKQRRFVEGVLGSTRRSEDKDDVAGNFAFSVLAV